MKDKLGQTLRQTGRCYETAGMYMDWIWAAVQIGAGAITGRLKKWLERHPYRTCPHCGHRKVWRGSNYCNMCGDRIRK